MKFFRFIMASLISIPLIVSCGDNAGDKTDSLTGKDSAVHSSPGSTVSLDIAVKTFAVKDSADKQTGWGYDLFVDGKRTIHQPIVPAVPGNDAFASEEDAKKTGELAMKKMKMTGSFPTITIHDLDSLGIKHQ
jgi:hypothetical protein